MAHISGASLTGFSAWGPPVVPCGRNAGACSSSAFPRTVTASLRNSNAGGPPIRLSGRNVGARSVRAFLRASGRHHFASSLGALVHRTDYRTRHRLEPPHRFFNPRGQTTNNVASRQACHAGKSNSPAGQTSVCTGMASDSHSVYSLDDVLDRIREAMGVEQLPEDSLMLVEGMQINGGHDQYSLNASPMILPASHRVQLGKKAAVHMILPEHACDTSLKWTIGRSRHWYKVLNT